MIKSRWRNCGFGYVPQTSASVMLERFDTAFVSVLITLSVEENLHFFFQFNWIMPFERLKFQQQNISECILSRILQVSVGLVEICLYQ